MRQGGKGPGLHPTCVNGGTKGLRTYLASLGAGGDDGVALAGGGAELVVGLHKTTGVESLATSWCEQTSHNKKWSLHSGLQVCWSLTTRGTHVVAEAGLSDGGAAYQGQEHSSQHASVHLGKWDDVEVTGVG